MKFFGRGIVWNASENKVLCRFTDGELITEDKNIIKKLKKLNYKYQNEVIEEKQDKK